MRWVRKTHGWFGLWGALLGLTADAGRELPAGEIGEIKSIYINPIRIEGILGLDHKEALPLLADLLGHATQERFQYRHAWQPGDLVIWDNRCLLHKANGDYDMNEVRYLYRVMLKGDVPR